MQLPCPPPNGTQVLFNYGYLPAQRQIFDYDNVPLAMLVFYIVFFVLMCVGFMCNYGKRTRNSKRKYGDSNSF